MMRVSRALFTSSSSLISKSLFDILVCPLSKQPLRVCQDSQSLVSDAIGVSFPTVKGEKKVPRALRIGSNSIVLYFCWSLKTLQIVDGIPCLVPKDAKVLEDDDKQKSDAADPT